MNAVTEEIARLTAKKMLEHPARKRKTFEPSERRREQLVERLISK